MDEQLKRLRALLLLPEPPDNQVIYGIGYHEAIAGVDELDAFRFGELRESLATTKLAPWSAAVLNARRQRGGHV